MASVAQIRLIKRLQREVGLCDADYRDLLRREGGEESCKNLDNQGCDAVIKALKAARPHKPGWRDRQIFVWRKYVKACGMSERESRAFLAGVAENIMSEESPLLVQRHYDDAMAAIESELDFRVAEGTAEWPPKTDPQYWRNRHPSSGGENTREAHKIKELWDELTGYLPIEKQNEAYLLGICSQCCKRRIQDHDTEMREWEALAVIEALKDKLEHAKKKLESEVPF